MGFFEKFTNPLWHFASTLDKERRRIAATVINGYEVCRITVKESLVTPLERNVLTTLKRTIDPDARERLIDEALIALLKSGRRPESDPSRKFHDGFVANLAEVWGAFALADRNNRLRCSEPSTLEGTHYSKDRDEARTQLLVQWCEILRLPSPNFVSDMNKHGFYKEWDDLSVALVSGLLTGASRAADEVLFAKAKSTAGNIPAHRIAVTRQMIETIAKAPLGAIHKPTQPQSNAEAVRSPVANRHPISAISSDEKHYEVRTRSDGRSEILLPDSARAVDFIRAMIEFMRPHLLEQDAQVCRDWVSRVTGVRIVQGHWTPEHVDALVRAYERFCWDGEDGVEPGIKKILRETYPTLAGTRIDILLSPEMRAVFRSWSSKGGNGTAPKADTVVPSNSRGGDRQALKPAAVPFPDANARRITPAVIPVEMLAKGKHYRNNHFKNLADWEKRMVNEFGPRVVPLLPSIWDETS